MASWLPLQHNRQALQSPFVLAKLKLYPLNSNSQLPLFPSFWQPPLYFLSLWIWLLLGSSYKGNHITLCLSTTVISVNIMSSRFYDVSECPSFLRLNIFHDTCLPHFKKSIHLSMDRRGILGSNSDSVFTLLRKRHIVFHSGCNILYSHQQYTRVPISSLSHNTCYCLCFW